MVTTSVETDGSAPGAPPRGRYRSLDGVRGLAAFAVVVCHCFLTIPALAQAYVDPNVMDRTSPSGIAAFSPLHVAWAGTEAVYLFFVLSGFVLTLPFARANPASWAGYYPKRILRLYLPVWAAFVLAFAGLSLFPREFPAEASLWLHAHVPALPARAIVDDLLLYRGPGLSNSALWSLRFEVLFSLLLPVYVFAGRKLPKLNVLKAVLLMAAVLGYSGTGLSARFFLPMFGFGCLMAIERERLANLGEAIDRLRFGRAVWWAVTLAALLLLNSYWTVRGMTSDPSALAFWVPVSRGLIVAGACLAIFAAVAGPARWLETAPLQWLGTRSFSLYLVHEPIVVSAAVALGGTPTLPVILAVAVPISLAVAEVFYRVVERPSQRLGRLVSQRVETRRATRRAPVAEPVPAAPAGP
ncbi:MAG TPA: acyltransferase [Actinomycetota bacterium]|nr:acyltransferase [Actinomycetota bacterium]